MEHPRVFHKPADIARAQMNLKTFTWAKRTFAALQAAAEAWLTRPDQLIRDLVPDRSPLGERSCCCPVHGGGPAEWTWVLDEPYVLRCGRGGEAYPSAQFPDDGEGWLDERPGSPTFGKRFYFLGRCRGYIYEQLEQAAEALALTAALTGEERYARKAAVILTRVADVYPGYPRHDNADGTLAYAGKIHSNTLVESYAALRFAKAYDLIVAAGALDPAERQHIEQNLLVPMGELLKFSVEHFYCPPEFPEPMNINAWLAAGMAAIGVAVGRPDFVSYALDSPRGFHCMMERSVLGDGIWFEGAPSYNVFTLEALYQLAEATLGYTDDAHPTPVNLYAHPKFRLMFTGPAAMLFPDGTLPPLGDSHAGERLPNWFFEVAYDRFGGPELAALLQENLGATEERTGEFALFHARPLPERSAGERRPLPSSFNLPEVGCAILRSRPESGDVRDQAALYLDYGAFRNEHSHYDLLNLVLFAEGRELVSDFGYLYWDHPLRSAWMQTAPSHNTVIVDKGPQARVRGRLLTFSAGAVIQAVEAAADNAYAATRQFRRSVILVQAGSGNVYAVDLFRVVGGCRHEWLLHAQARALSVTGLELAPAAGKLGQAGGYEFIDLAQGSVGRADGFCQAVFAAEEGEPGLRLHFALLPGEEVLTGWAEGQRVPVADEGAKVPILVRRRFAEASQFVSVLEPYRNRFHLQSVDEVLVRSVSGQHSRPESAFPAVGLRVVLADGTEDLILSQENGRARPGLFSAQWGDGEVEWQARLAVCRRRAGRITHLHLVEGTRFIDDRGRALMASGTPWTGEVQL